MIHSCLFYSLSASKKALTSSSRVGVEMYSISPLSSTIAKSKVVVRIEGVVIIRKVEPGEERVTGVRRKGFIWARLSAFSLGIKDILIFVFYYAG